MQSNLKRSTILAAIFAIAALWISPSVSGAAPFPYPTVPDTISSFTGRADYFVTHFWDKADMKRIFSNRQNVKAAMGDYFAMMPHARRDVAAQSIAELLNRLSKQPKDLAFMAETAQGLIFSDSAAFWSDDLMLPFATAASKNKKVDEGTRLRMERIATILQTNRQGLSAPNPKMTLIDGSESDVYTPDDNLSYQVLFFNDPDCTGCNAARMKLDADYLTSRLINAGIVKIISIYPGEMDDEFKRIAARFPSTWAIGANPDVDLIYDLRTQPCFYLLTGQGYIVDKNMPVEEILGIFSRLRNLKAAQEVSTEPYKGPDTQATSNTDTPNQTQE